MALQGRDFIGEVRPVMERLSDVSRVSVHLGVLDSFEVVHVGKVDSPEMVGVASKVGTRAVPHVTALGKALLAARPDDVVVGHIDHAHVLPATHRLSDIDQLMADLRRARDRGFCLDEEEPSLASAASVCPSWAQTELRSSLSALTGLQHGSLPTVHLAVRLRR